jgi:deazaflavin-dependent oxidoreductase (nitroreductase family)
LRDYPWCDTIAAGSSVHPCADAPTHVPEVVVSTTPSFKHRAIRGMMKITNPIHTRIYRDTRGRFGRRWSNGRQPTLLLTTTGRRTGEPRTQPLGYVGDGDGLVVMGSNAGLPRHPTWYLNLQANPDVTIELEGEKRRMRARTAEGTERERFWEIVSTRYPMYVGYQAGISRQIPVVVLEPAP